MNNITVSVIMMTYGHEPYIIDAIEGVRIQNCNFNVELIIADDNSPDGTKNKVEDYLNSAVIPKNIDIKYFQHKKNKGANSNYLWASKKAKGKYIALCEGDDYWTDPLKLQKQLDFLEGNEEYSFCFTRFQTKDERTNTFLDDENSKHFDKNQSFIDYDFERFYKGWHIGTQTVMFINTPETKNFFKQYQLPRDMHLYVELLKQGKGACLKDFCAVYRLTGKGVYTSTSKFQQIIKGAKVYEDIYKSNKDIIFIELKYRKFFKSYLRMLASNKNILGYVVQMFKSFKITKKVNYLKEDSIFLFKKFYSKL